MRLEFATIGQRQFDQYADFLIARTDESRRSYFGGSISPGMIRDLVKSIKNSNDVHHVFLAKHNGIIVAAIHMAVIDSGPAELGLMVHENYRGQGIASTTLKYAESEFARLGITDVFVNVSPYNLPMRRFAAKHKLTVEVA